jgi:putative Mn2+ efflux pump MntP
MDIVTLIFIAVGLSFDSFAVSITSGIIANHIKFWQATRIAATFALFQSLFPLIGWFVASQVSYLIVDYDHWIAFILLGFIGGKMIHESRKPDDERTMPDPSKLMVLIGMAIATSIDALIVGATFALVHINIYFSVLVIGIATYILSMLGLLFGKKVGVKFGSKMEILGGIILILIGTKILIEDLFNWTF